VADAQSGTPPVTVVLSEEVVELKGVPDGVDGEDDEPLTVEPVVDEPVIVDVEPVIVDVEPVIVDVEPVIVEVEPVIVDVEPVIVEVEPVIVDVEPVIVDVEPLIVESPIDDVESLIVGVEPVIVEVVEGEVVVGEHVKQGFSGVGHAPVTHAAPSK